MMEHSPTKHKRHLRVYTSKIEKAWIAVFSFIVLILLFFQIVLEGHP